MGVVPQKQAMPGMREMRAMLVTREMLAIPQMRETVETPETLETAAMLPMVMGRAATAAARVQAGQVVVDRVAVLVTVRGRRSRSGRAAAD